MQPLSPAGEPWGQGLHKALLWLGDGRHRVAFVPALTSRQARLIAGPGQGAGYVPGGSAVRESHHRRAGAALRDNPCRGHS